MVTTVVIYQCSMQVGSMQIVSSHTIMFINNVVHNDVLCNNFSPYITTESIPCILHNITSIPIHQMWLCRKMKGLRFKQDNS